MILNKIIIYYIKFLISQQQTNQQNIYHISIKSITIIKISIHHKEHHFIDRQITLQQKIKNKKKMEIQNQMLRYELWHHLKIIFNKYADNGNEIKTSKVQQIVRDVLGQVTPQQIQYVTNNMFRLDTKQSGSIDFLSFGNFLFKRHCGEIALQNMHKKHMIQKGSQRKINLKQFFQLINNAYAFLHIKTDAIPAQSVFRQADKDKDGYITYVEFFQYIEKCICQTKAQFDEYQKVEILSKPIVYKKWHSKIRRYLWIKLKNIYEIFAKGQNIIANEINLRELINEILGKISQTKMTYLLNNFSKLEKNNLQFSSFITIFINLIAQFGLNAYIKKNTPPKQKINKQQFIILLRSTFKFINLNRVKKNILNKIYKKIDSNHDGFITTNEYLTWIKKYLSVEINLGVEYYIIQDDENIKGFDIFYPQFQVLNIKKPLKLIQLKFISYELSDEVIKKLQQQLIQYNNNSTLTQKQLTTILKNKFKLNNYQLDYSLRNLYNQKNNIQQNITISKFIYFCVQQFFGQIIMQQLYQSNLYTKGNNKIMNLQQFNTTLNRALSYIQYHATNEQISQLFKQIDVDNSGWISFQNYYLFLLYYFGSLRTKPKHTAIDIISDNQWLDHLSRLSPLDRLIRIIFDQLVQIFSQYHSNINMVLEKNSIQTILRHVFELTDSEVSSVLLKYSNIKEQSKQNISFVLICKIILQIYFIEIILNRKYKTTKKNSIILSKKDFIDLIKSACFFLKIKPTEQDLTQIFKIIDIKTNRYITFNQYSSFIKKYFGISYLLQSQVSYLQQINILQNISVQQQQFINEIENQLKIYFNKYDIQKKGYLTEQQQKKCIKQLLKITEQKQINYIIQKYYQQKSNKNTNIQFKSFSSFIILYLGQLALQINQNKKILNEKQFFLVLSNTFSFLSIMPKSQLAAHAIYTRIGKGSDPSYGAYLRWINSIILNKFK